MNYILLTFQKNKDAGGAHDPELAALPLPAGQVIGKGRFGQGAVWVATRIPDGHVCAHANQARTTTLVDPRTDVFYSPDVVTFAQRLGLYPMDGALEDFSFSVGPTPLWSPGLLLLLLLLHVSPVSIFCLFVSLSPSLCCTRTPPPPPPRPSAP